MIETSIAFWRKAILQWKQRLWAPGRLDLPSSPLTVSLIAVLIPLLFMGDIVGRLFREFAVTLAVTIVISALVSLTLTPMMAARLLKNPKTVKHGRVYQATERAYERVIEWYGTTLRWVLKTPDHHVAGHGGGAGSDSFIYM